jgi:hypothetical protein
MVLISRVDLDGEGVDPVTHLGAEDVVNEPVLGDPTETFERGRGDDRIEVLPVAGNLGTGSRDPGLDPFLQLLGSCRHAHKGSEKLSLY